MEDQRLIRDREDDPLEDAREQMMPGNSIVKGMVARLAATRFVRETLAEKADLKAILFDNLIRYCFRGVEV